MGGHDMVRRMDRQGGVLIWCIKCSGCARQRMGPKLMSSCTPEQVGTKECCKMLNRIQVFGEGRIQVKEARVTGRRLWIELKTRGFMSWSRKGNGMLAERKCWKRLRCIAQRRRRSIEGIQGHA